MPHIILNSGDIILRLVNVQEVDMISFRICSRARLCRVLLSKRARQEERHRGGGGY